MKKVGKSIQLKICETKNSRDLKRKKKINMSENVK